LSFLVNAAWQAPLLAVSAWVAARVIRRAPAAYRHRLWLTALVLTLLAPLGSALRVRVPEHRSAPTDPRSGADPPGGALGRPHLKAGSAGHGSGLQVELGAAGRLAAIGYLGFLLLKAVRLCGSWRRTQRIVRTARAAPATLSTTASGALEGVELRISDEAATPLTFGVRRPVIVIPSRFARTASRESLRAILAHEHAHVARRDCALNLACELTGFLVSFHPAVRFLRRRIRGAAEAACDDAAAALIGARPYAETLLSVAAAAERRTRFAGALGILDGDALEDRMSRILSPRPSLGRRTASAALAVAILAVVAVGRLAAASALDVKTEAGPSDVVGRWTGQLADGPMAGKPAAELTVSLTPDGPDIVLTLFRYQMRPDGTAQVDRERLTVVHHAVERGVLQFRTHTESFRLRPGDPPSAVDTDWEFAVVGPDRGELTVVRNSKFEAERAQGRDVPPPPPPLAMTRVAKP
jgi:beta-lactamase regulating signal transducer with metallopeptidase domain